MPGDINLSIPRVKIIEIPEPPAMEQLIRCFASKHLPFVLESSQSNDGLGEWSFLGAEPFQVLSGTSLSDLRAAMQPFLGSVDGQIPFVGGAVGYLAYDYGRRIERIPSLALDDRAIPDLHFGLYDGVAAVRHATGQLYLLAHGFREPVGAILDRLREWIDASRIQTAASPVSRGPWEWNLSKDDFTGAVDKVKAYIAAGDVYQVNVSRRARCTYQGSGLDLYLALRQGNPAPYAAYIGTGTLELISTSPEQYLRKSGHDLVTRPIKGTRARSGNLAQDLQSAAELSASLKDRAELLMIVDLERNDLGRVAEFGSVRVDALFKLEYYKTVIHQTAQVRASLAKGKDIFDVVEALFPGGSVTGAPKVRAMEIIEEIEPTRRGVYCGSIGYIGYNGDAEFNIAIRSLHLKNGILDYQVGSGIVWDSEAESEYVETADKGRAIRETIDALCQS